MRNFKIVVVVMAGIQPLVQLVICDAVQLITADITAVVPMDHLAHQPEIRLLFVHTPAHLL